jgi:phosphoglycerol transferase
MPLVNENDHASLGIIGSIGFLILIACLFLRRQSATTPSVMEGLSMLNLFAILLAMVGGFAGILGLLFPEIRAYNRICVYVGFFAFFAVALSLHHLLAWCATVRQRVAFGSLLAALTAAGILDQTPNPLPFHQRDEEWRHDAEFVQQIESALPAGAMVFQLPFVPFPENPPVNKMADYEHMRGYLHSQHLRWSYPTMRGREGHTWQENVASLDAKDMLPRLAAAGFRGLYIDRFGFADGAADVEAKLIAILKYPPLVSPNGRLAFFDLGRYAQSRGTSPSY